MHPWINCDCQLQLSNPSAHCVGVLSLDNSAMIPWDWIPEEMMIGTQRAHSNGSRAAQNECACAEGAVQHVCPWAGITSMKRHKIGHLRFWKLPPEVFPAVPHSDFLGPTCSQVRGGAPLATCCVYNPFGFTCPQATLAESYLRGDLLGKVEVFISV